MSLRPLALTLWYIDEVNASPVIAELTLNECFALAPFGAGAVAPCRQTTGNANTLRGGVTFIEAEIPNLN